MSFRGRGGGGGFRGGGGGNRFSGGGRGGGRGGYGGRGADLGPPDTVMPFCHFLYKCQRDLVCRADITDVPFFNAPIYLENKECIGKIDEIFGRVTEYCVTIRPSDEVSADSFNEGDKLYIDPQKILPLTRFTQESKRGGGRGRGGGGRGRGGGGFGGRGRGGGGRGGGGFGGRGGGGFGGRGGGGRGGGGFGGRGGGGFGGRGGGGFGGRGGGGRGGGGFSRGGGRGFH